MTMAKTLSPADRKMNTDNSSFEGALIINGFIPDNDLWLELNELLAEIESLPQPIPWNGFCARQLHTSVHRKNQLGEINPPLDWAASALSAQNACAAIDFKCIPFEAEPDQEIPLDRANFQDVARTFSFAANISRPGCFGVHSVASRQNDSCKIASGISNELVNAVDYSRKTGWPSLAPVPFGLVWIWIVKNFYHMRPGDTPISRAFNAYTRLFEKGSDFPFGLVSALIGIEALFATTTSAVGDQVRRRAQLLLGNRNSFKKDIDKMYAARSAFLHGGTLLSANGYSWEPPEEIETKLEKIWEAEDIASAVLVSSLQRIVEKGWTGLKFSEKLTGLKSETIEPVEDIVSGIRMPCALESELKKWGAPFIRRFAQ